MDDYRSVTPANRERVVDTTVIFALFLVHFIGDFYCAFVSPLLPVFVERFSLTLAQVGLITGISRLLAFVVQPSVGYLADHYQTRLFLLGGPLLAIAFISVIGIAPSFSVLIACVALGSIGSSMFHPTAAGMVSTYSGRHFGLSMSIFNMGGTLAFAVGPLVITYVVVRYGLSASPYTMVFGLVVMVALFRIVPVPEGEGLGSLGFVGSIRKVLGTVWKSIVLLWVVMVLFFAGFFLLATLPLGVAMAQEMAPRGKSMVSSLMMGLAFGTGGMLTPLTGWFADLFAIRPVLISLALIPLLTIPIVSVLPEKDRRPHPGRL